MIYTLLYSRIIRQSLRCSARVGIIVSVELRVLLEYGLWPRVMSEGPDTFVRDQLARQRTELANERTLLAYIRTALGFFIVGIPGTWWSGEPSIQALGAVFLLTGLVCLGIGIRRFFTLREKIDHPS